MTYQLKNEANAAARRPLAAMLCAGVLSMAPARISSCKVAF